MKLDTALGRLLRSDPDADRAAALYAALARQARSPEPFRDHGVPDTLDGRFDSLCLHMALVIRRLAGAGEAGTRLAQALYAAMFDDMDRTLRELGVGDLGVSRRVRQMAEALMGRIAAYGAALEKPSDEALRAALARNLYGTLKAPDEACVAAVARYARASAERLARHDLADLAAAPRFAAWSEP